MSNLTTQQKSQIDKLWTELWTGGITNPLTVIEQISFLMFARLLDDLEKAEERKAARTKKPTKGRFAGKHDPRRWSSFRQLEGNQMLVVVRDQVFPHLRELGAGTSFGEFMKDAQLMIQKPSLLVEAVNRIEELQLTSGDAKGDLYEYLLSKLTTAGINGQFRTPRHVIRFMVELLDPKPTEVVGDPACGTAGFLVGVMEYLTERYTSDAKGASPGDLLEPYRAHIRSGMFHGFDFDATMLRIAAMNLMLHGVDDPAIRYQDTLSSSFLDRHPKQAESGFQVILANPPFKGSLDEGDVHPSLTRVVKTKKTELLFVALVLRMLKVGGRSATIVPDGVLFGSSKAHKALRQVLVEENQLEGVISLPSGVFKPYAGVSTAILVFTKGGSTKEVFFYDVQADGFSLDDKRVEVKEDDLPDALKRWRQRGKGKNGDRTKKHFVVPVEEIVGNGWDLSINRYKEVVHAEVEYEAPGVIIGRLKVLEEEIGKELRELEGML
jgi:type I restriction enzyme M protein